MAVVQAMRLKEFEKESARLKRLVADLSLDKHVLKDVAEENFKAPSGVIVPWSVPASKLSTRDCWAVVGTISGLTHRQANEINGDALRRRTRDH